MNAVQDSYTNFSVLGFPCNQFWRQEPGANGTEIMNGIQHVRPGGGFRPNFLLFNKVEVNGENEHPLYKYLKSSCPPTRTYFSDKDRLFYDPLNNNDIRWNWEKFLITKSGKPYMRYDPGTRPSEIRGDVEFLLMQDY